MEDKLQEYRVRKRRQETLESFKEKLLNMVSFDTFKTNQKPEDVAIKVNETQAESAQESEDRESIVSSSSEIEETAPAKKLSYLTYCTYLIYFLIWATLYAIAIEMRFGIVFFMISLLLFVCLNTRTGPRKPGEISAYSIFNKDCESIDGTFKAEMFEKQLGVRRL